MRGVITVPKKVVTGAFTLLFSFPMDVEFTQADLLVETLEGDALGHAKDSFIGSGSHYQLLCYIPDARSGKTRFSVTKAGVDVKPVVVEYDTVRTVIATWGTPVKRSGKIDIPVTFDTPIKRLRKQHFRISELRCPCQLYGQGDTYDLVVSPSRAVKRFEVTISGTVEKSNGLAAAITENSITVEV